MMTPVSPPKSWAVFGIVVLILACLLLVSGILPSSEPSVPVIQKNETVVIYDSTGNRVELDHPATRIIALNTQAAEMLIIIGAGDHIVGVADSVKNHKEIMDKIPYVPSVGSGTTPDIEKILTLHPDLIITYASLKPKNFDSLVGSKVNIVALDCYKLESLSDDAKALGILTGNPDGAARYILFNERYQTLIQSRLANLSSDEQPRVLGEGGDYSPMVRVSGGGQAIAALHAINVYGNNSVPEWPVVSPEWILEQDPDIVIKTIDLDVNNASLKDTYHAFITRPGYSRLKAVQSIRVFIYDRDLVSGTGSVIGLVYLAKAFYPDRFSDIEPATVLDEYTREFHFTSSATDNFYPPFREQNQSPDDSDESLPKIKGLRVS